VDGVVSSNCPYMSSDVSISAALTTDRSQHVERRTFSGPYFSADTAWESNANACTGAALERRLLPMYHPRLDGCLINWELANEGEAQRCSPT
jgi:hypothetical protein